VKEKLMKSSISIAAPIIIIVTMIMAFTGILPDSMKDSGLFYLGQFFLLSSVTFGIVAYKRQNKKLLDKIQIITLILGTIIIAFCVYLGISLDRSIGWWLK
jgi:heme/copper-type cytochrome/quinol oxidase subunit 3